MINNANNNIKNETGYYCVSCSETFEFNYKLVNHNKTEHKPKYKIRCPECKKKMDSKENLLLHIGFVHDLLWCDRCKETFRNQHLLRKHIIKYHNSNKTSKKKFGIKKENETNDTMDQPNDYESIVENILNSIFDFGPRQLIEQILPYFTIKEGKKFKIFYTSSKKLDLEKIQDLLKAAFIIDSSINQNKANFTLSIDFRHIVFLSQQVTFPTELERKILNEILNPKRNKFFSYGK